MLHKHSNDKKCNRLRIKINHKPGTVPVNFHSNEVIKDQLLFNFATL